MQSCLASFSLKKGQHKAEILETIGISEFLRNFPWVKI